MYLTTIFLLLFALLYSLYDKQKKYSNFLWCFLCAWLIFHDGLRWETGTDWEPYLNYFKYCLDLNASFDIGYVLFSRAVRIVTENYTVFLLLHAVIVYLFVFSSIKEYSPYKFLSLFLFYCLMLPVLGMNRQYIALVIVLFSIRYIIDKKFSYFLLLVLCASLFHISAILFFPAYYLRNRFSALFVIITLSLASFISILGLVNKLPLGVFGVLGAVVEAKMKFYAESNVDTNLVFTIFAIIKRTFWLIILYSFDKYINNKNRYYDLMLNLYFISSALYILFNGTIFQVFVSRGLIYFNITEIFLVAYVLSIFKNNISRLLVLSFIVLYGVGMMNKGIATYRKPNRPDIFIPYKSVYMNKNFKRF